MKTIRLVHACKEVALSAFLVLFIVAAARAQTSSLPSAGSQALPPPTAYQIVSQDADSRVWQGTNYELAPDGTVRPRLRQYKELATGLNRWHNGQWVESREEIDVLPDGTGAATNGQHQAFFPGDIGQGTIRVITPGGQTLESRPLGLFYEDGTNIVEIAELTDSTGYLAGSNQMIYPAAFAGIKTDLRYTYTKAGVEQDIILRQQPPTPEAVGLNSGTTRLQLLTEFFNPPTPAMTTRRLRSQGGLSLNDETLNFGTMQMLPGNAFLLGTNTPSVRVAKTWLNVDGRQILVKEVPVAAVVDDLAELPLTASRAKSGSNQMLCQYPILPTQRPAASKSMTKKLARADLKLQSGLVMDYYLTLSSSLTNFTFQGDTTYFLSGTTRILGTTTIEGGTVIKFATNAADASLQAYGPVTCLTTPYCPAEFTAMDDNTVGAPIAGSTGLPPGFWIAR